MNRLRQIKESHANLNEKIHDLNGEIYGLNSGNKDYFTVPKLEDIEELEKLVRHKLNLLAEMRKEVKATVNYWTSDVAPYCDWCNHKFKHGDEYYIVKEVDGLGRPQDELVCSSCHTKR